SGYTNLKKFFDSVGFFKISNGSFRLMDSQELVTLTVDHLLKLKAAKNFYENSQPITSLDFDDTGEFCVTASADDSINLYNCLQGR
ncbi:19210_t:CDS:1, partial [Cetraspora pellucida]